MAEVMGNPIGTKSYYKGDANDLYGSSHNGVYTINGAAGKPTNIPEGVNNGILTVSGGRDEYTTQIVTKAVSSEVYIRFYNGASWSPWQRIDNFGYNSFEELSEGVVSARKFVMNTGTDLNDVTETGIYRAGGVTVVNAPTSVTYFMLIVESFDNRFVKQTLVHNDGRIWVRSQYASEWRAWTLIVS